VDKATNMWTDAAKIFSGICPHVCLSAHMLKYSINTAQLQTLHIPIWQNHVTWASTPHCRNASSTKVRLVSL